MANTIYMHEEPQYEGAVDIVVYYDNTQDRFLVTSTDKETGGYTVSRIELIGNTFKYTSEVINEILHGIPEGEDDILVLVTNIAMNSIHLICDGNRNLF